MTTELSSYAELAGLLDALPVLLREARRRRRLTMREAAAEMGCSISTVCRIEAGEDCVLSNALAVLRWLGSDGAPVGAALERTPGSHEC